MVASDTVWAQVVDTRVDLAKQGLESLDRRIDHDVDVLGRTRRSVERARKRSGDHVGDSRSVEQIDDPLEEAWLAHGSSRGAPGQAALKRSSPRRRRRSAYSTHSGEYSGWRLWIPAAEILRIASDCSNASATRSAPERRACASS